MMNANSEGYDEENTTNATRRESFIDSDDEDFARILNTALQSDFASLVEEVPSPRLNPTIYQREREAPRPAPPPPRTQSQRPVSARPAHRQPIKPQKLPSPRKASQVQVPLLSRPHHQRIRAKDSIAIHDDEIGDISPFADDLPGTILTPHPPSAPGPQAKISPPRTMTTTATTSTTTPAQSKFQITGPRLSTDSTMQWRFPLSAGPASSAAASSTTTANNGSQTERIRRPASASASMQRVNSFSSRCTSTTMSSLDDAAITGLQPMPPPSSSLSSSLRPPSKRLQEAAKNNNNNNTASSGDSNGSSSGMLTKSGSIRNLRALLKRADRAGGIPLHPSLVSSSQPPPPPTAEATATAAAAAAHHCASTTTARPPKLDAAPIPAVVEISSGVSMLKYYSALYRHRKEIGVHRVQALKRNLANPTQQFSEEPIIDEESFQTMLAMMTLAKVRKSRSPLKKAADKAMEQFSQKYGLDLQADRRLYSAYPRKQQPHLQKQQREPDSPMSPLEFIDLHTNKKMYIHWNAPVPTPGGGLSRVISISSSPRMDTGSEVPAAADTTFNGAKRKRRVTKPGADRAMPKMVSMPMNV